MPFNTSNSQIGAHITAAILASFAVFAYNVNAEQPAEAALSTTMSIGTPIDGRLAKGEAMPRRGAGFELTATTQKRRTRFAVPELIFLIKDAAFRVQRTFRGSVLQIADLSKRQGGPIEHHGSHQNGLDADLLFYLKESGGSYSKTDQFIPVDANGFSTQPPMKYVFDTARNWALIAHLLTSEKASVQWIFTANHIKDMLIEYAHELKAPKHIIRRAMQVIHQPAGKAHVDHFHVRIFCPTGDAPNCEAMGPTWAWAR